MLENIINTINAIFFHPWKGEEFLFIQDITKAAL